LSGGPALARRAALARRITVNFLCRDSIFAAPIVLDLALFMDLGARWSAPPRPGAVAAGRHHHRDHPGERDDALGVRGAERDRDLPREGEGGAPRQRGAPAPCAQRLAPQQLHDDEGGAGRGPAEVVDLDDARVLDHDGRARLVEEPRDGVRLGRQLGLQHLHRGEAAEQRVLGCVHAPMPPRPSTPVMR